MACEAASICVCNAPFREGFLEGEVLDGAMMRVSVVHGEVGMVVVGDDVPIQGGAITPSVGEVVIARVDVRSDGTTARPESLLEGDEVTVPSCSAVAPVPGTVPKTVFIEASLGNAFQCADALEAHDPAWVTVRGDCGAANATGAGGSTGAAGGEAVSPTIDADCSVGPGQPGGAADAASALPVAIPLLTIPLLGLAARRLRRR